jgi:predicted permease
MPGIEPPEPEGFTVGFNVVSPAYFETIRMPLLAGRTFTDADAASARNVTIINDAFARRFWPHVSPIGQRVRLAGSDTEIIGVVPDGKYRSFSEAQRFYAYFPVGRRYDPDLWLHVRARGDAAAAAAAVRAVLRELDPDVAPISVEPMDRLMESTLFLQHLGARVVGGFGLAALLLAAVGLFGVLSFTVGQRTREIGVRMALGAAPRDAALLVVRQGLMLVLAGIVVGLVLAVPASRAMRVLLENLSPHDPVTMAAVVMVFVTAGLGAAYWPARRATRIDPAAALRAE